MMMKRKGMLAAFIFSIILLLQCSPAFGAERIEQESDLCGVWKGTYTGIQDWSNIERQIRLDIDYAENGVIEGSATISDGEYGKYFFTGTVDFSEKKIAFSGNQWLSNPHDMSFGEFEGLLSLEKGLMEGLVDGETDRTFSLEKVSSDYSTTRVDLSAIPKSWDGEYDGNSGWVTVRRDYEMHIQDVDSDGTITGVAIFSPSTKADAEYGANGSYYFSGSIDNRTGKIEMQGKEWIDYPVSHDNFVFIELEGYLNVEEGKIIGTTENGIWEMAVIDYEALHTVSGFEIGKDNNNFIHSDDEDWEGAGFVGVENYKIDQEYFDRLTQHSTWGEKNRIRKAMWNRDLSHWRGQWEGSCYGIAMSMGLLYEGYIDISSLTDTNRKSYFTLKYPSQDRKFLNMINFYQLSQSLENGGKKSAAVSYTINKKMYSDGVTSTEGYDTLPVFLKKMVEYCSSNHVELLGFSTESSGHAVLITGCSFDKEREQYIVDIYDENSVSSSTDIGEFSQMIIEKDFSGFTLYDYDGDVEVTQDTYKTMYFLDWSKLGHVAGGRAVADKGYTRIDFPVDSEFQLTNRYGETLFYDGEQFSGDMTIHGVDTLDHDDDVRIVLDVDSSSQLTFSETGEEIDVNIHDKDGFAAVNGESIDQAMVDLNDEIIIDGEGYRFAAYMSTDEATEDKTGLISISGKTNAELRVAPEGNSLSVEAESTVTDVETAAFKGTNVEKRKYDVSTNSFTIEEDAKIDGAQEITKGNLQDASVSIGKTKYTYTGKAVKPAVKVTIGGVILKKNRDYKITYANHFGVGEATIIVRGIGNYEGSISKNFKIVPKGTSITKLTGSKKSIKVKWRKQEKKTSGYQIQCATTKTFTKKTTKTKWIAKSSATMANLSKVKSNKKYFVRVRTYKKIDGKKYFSPWSKVKVIHTIAAPKKTALTKVVANKKGFTAKWKKQSKGANGYQIQYSTKAKFPKKFSKTKFVKKNKTTKVKVSNLKGAKTYYVRVRTYKVKDGMKYYSPWSKSKKVKIKK